MKIQLIKTVKEVEGKKFVNWSLTNGITQIAINPKFFKDKEGKDISSREFAKLETLYQYQNLSSDAE